MSEGITASLDVKCISEKCPCLIIAKYTDHQKMYSDLYFMIHENEKCHAVTDSLSNDTRRLETRMPPTPSQLSFCGAHSLQPVRGAKFSSIHRLTSSPTLPPYFIVPHPHFFPCYQWTLPGQTMKLGRISPSSFTPIKFTVRKGGRRGGAVVETSISDNCFWHVEQVIRRLW